MRPRRVSYRVSVIIPVFQASFLSEALTSIMVQRRPADEVIVVDDGSPDRAQVRRLLAALLSESSRPGWCRRGGRTSCSGA